MADNKENKNKKPEKKGFSSYWFYAFIIVFLVGINMVMTMVSQPEEITLNKFEDLVRAGDVDHIEVINKQVVRIFLKPESVANYEDVNSNTKLTTSLNAAHYDLYTTYFYHIMCSIKTGCQFGIRIDVFIVCY